MSERPPQPSTTEAYGPWILAERSFTIGATGTQYTVTSVGPESRECGISVGDVVQLQRAPSIVGSMAWMYSADGSGWGHYSYRAYFLPCQVVAVDRKVTA